VSSENSTDASNELATAECNLNESFATVNHHKTELENAKVKAAELYQIKHVVTQKLQRTLMSKDQLQE
jgi:tmRNA-binding protein